jgi:thiamine biosynthesis lipoprotein
MIHNQEFQVMGARILALVEAEDRPLILGDVPSWFEEWEQVLSRFRSDSELCRLNLNLEPDKPTVVSQILWDVLQVSLEAEHETAGLVNPSILDALVYAGYEKSFDPNQRKLINTASDFNSKVPSLSDIYFNEYLRAICLPKGAHIDFGGVAKGWAAQRATDLLKKYGPTLVSAGGDISVSGPLINGDPWSIGIEDPFRPGYYLETVYLDFGGVATSGKDYRNWTNNGKHQHHIIDPSTGLPAETDILTATVIAPTVMRAEAMAKAVLISGSKAGISLLESDDSLAGLVVLENGERIDSQNLIKYF